jgi:hypothetical protein
LTSNKCRAPSAEAQSKDVRGAAALESSARITAWGEVDELRRKRNPGRPFERRLYRHWRKMFESPECRDECASDKARYDWVAEHDWRAHPEAWPRGKRACSTALEYGRVCPRCASPKSLQALLCMACFHDRLRGRLGAAHDAEDVRGRRELETVA